MVKWKPNRNTEREAIRKHKDKWIILDHRNGKILIQSEDKSDMRWILHNQIQE